MTKPIDALKTIARYVEAKKPKTLADCSRCITISSVPIKLRTTPAMAAGVTSRLWEIGDIVDVLEPWEAVQVDHGEAV